MRSHWTNAKHKVFQITKKMVSNYRRETKDYLPKKRKPFNRKHWPVRLKSFLELPPEI